MKTKEEKKRRRKEKIKKVKEEIKKEFKLNAPNILTLLRLILTFFIVYMIFSDYSRLNVAIVFSIVALSDALDGYIARKFKQTSLIGARLDQVIDKIFGIIVILSLVIYFLINHIDKKFILMLFLISSREIVDLPGLIIRIIRNKDVYELGYITKVVTFFQWTTIALIIAGFNFAIYPAILTCILGIISSLNYVKNSFL